MFFGSTLRFSSDLTVVSNFVQNELTRSSEIDDNAVPGYIEALANWNLEKLLDLIDEGNSAIWSECCWSLLHLFVCF